MNARATDLEDLGQPALPRREPNAAWAAWPLHVRCALLAAALACASLAGWIADVPLLTMLLPGRPSLSPMTAVSFLVGAAAIACLPARTGCALWLASMETLCGLAIVAAQLAGLPEHQWIPVDWWSSKLTGIAFIASGMSSMLLASGRLAAGQVLAFAVLLLAGLLGAGHVVPSADLYRVLPGTGVAIPTVIAFGAVSLGQLLSFSQTGVSAALTSRNPAGKAGLRLLFAGAGVALVLTVAVVLLYRARMFDAMTALLLLAWGFTALLGASLWGLALAVDRADLARMAAERERQHERQMVIAAITHDLRSPLHSASLSGQVLERLATEPQAAAAAARLQRSHRRLDRLLRSLLDSLSVGAGEQLALHASHLQLAALVQEVIEENEGVLAQQVTPIGVAQGWWDREALFRVLENLLLNAVKYGDAGTPIHCGIRALGNDRVAVTVRNRGAAIPPEEWESIFQPFARREAVRDSGPVGWGVGLAYARSVAISHGGSVRVATSDSDGTTFELVLPVDSRPFTQLP